MSKQMMFSRKRIEDLFVEAVEQARECQGEDSPSFAFHYLLGRLEISAEVRARLGW